MHSWLISLLLIIPIIESGKTVNENGFNDTNQIGSFGYGDSGNITKVIDITIEEESMVENTWDEYSVINNATNSGASAKVYI